MKTIPKDIKEIFDKLSNKNLIYEDENFILVFDPKHNNKYYHYTVWSKKEIKSILDINKSHIYILNKFLEDIQKLYFFNNPKKYITFPPDFWNLHIHIVPENYISHRSNSQIFYINDIINNINKDEEYYRKNVYIIL